MVSSRRRRRDQALQAAAPRGDVVNEWTMHAHKEQQRREYLEAHPERRRRLTLSEWNHRTDFETERRWRRDEMLRIWQEAERQQVMELEDVEVWQRLQEERLPPLELLQETLSPWPSPAEWMVARHPRVCARTARVALGWGLISLALAAQQALELLASERRLGVAAAWPLCKKKP